MDPRYLSRSVCRAKSASGANDAKLFFVRPKLLVIERRQCTHVLLYGLNGVYEPENLFSMHIQTITVV